MSATRDASHEDALLTTLTRGSGRASPMLQIGPLILQNRLIMAPMAGITSLPFRCIAKRFGAGLVATEMISAEGLARRQKKTIEYLRSAPQERPLSVQIFGSDPHVMAEACRVAVDAGADLVDINMGCPARKVLKTGSGGALLRSPDRIRAIVSAVRPVCAVPLTVKIRAGWTSDEPTASAVAGIVEDCGADAVALHPRSVVQGFSGRADWGIIAQVKSRVRIPVIGNGDIRSPSDALRMRHETGCDGLMIGRAAVGNPWIFRDIRDIEAGKNPQPPNWPERRKIIWDHFELLVGLMGEERAARIMRGLMSGYTRGLYHSSRFRQTFTSIRDRKGLMAALDDYGTILMGFEADSQSEFLAGTDPGLDEVFYRPMECGLCVEHNGP